jgi:predicted kinase
MRGVCYAKPGPRCTRHAREKVEKALDRYNRARANGNDASLRDAATKLAVARDEYWSTPGGQEDLTRLMEKAIDDEQRDKYQRLLDTGITTRREQKAAYDQAQVEAEYADHLDTMEQKVQQAKAAGLETHRLHKTPEGHWTTEREQLHDEVLDKLIARHGHVPRQRKALIAGGMGGAGKSTTLRDYAGYDPDDYVTVNPDDIKEELAKRGAIPAVEGLSPMEASTLVHEEASHLAKRLAAECQAKQMNVIWDITMSSKNSVNDRLNLLEEDGYDVEMVFVDIPPEVSERRAIARHRRGWEKHRIGTGHGGRYLPPNVNRPDPDYSSANRRVFESVKNTAVRWQVWDNSVDGRAPQVVSTGTG